jgi:hypothetical protein
MPVFRLARASLMFEEEILLSFNQTAKRVRCNAATFMNRLAAALGSWLLVIWH